MGDANIRIGELQPNLITHLHNSPMRRSQDKVSNANGRDFMEMCDNLLSRIPAGAGLQLNRPLGHINFPITIIQLVGTTETRKLPTKCM